MMQAFRAALVFAVLGTGIASASSAGPVERLTPQVLAGNILAALADACPTEDQMLAVIEAQSADADIETIATALPLVATSRDWCDGARASLQWAMDAAQVVIAAEIAAPAAPQPRIFARRADPPGGAGGAAYTN